MNGILDYHTVYHSLINQIDKLLLYVADNLANIKFICVSRGNDKADP